MKFYIIISIFFMCSCIAIKPTQRIEFAAPDIYPEGIAFDSTRQLYYVSSARTGTVGKVSPDGAYSVLHSDSNFKSSYGMKVHPDGNRLFVCVGDANYSKYTSPDTRNKMARLIILDLATGKKLNDIDLAKLIPGNHFANDLSFDLQGNCYITDSYAHAIYKVTSNGQGSVFSKDKLYETEGIGLNGIVYHQDGYILVDNSNTGAIYKININNPGQVSKVKINQFFLGADGMLLKDNNSVVMVVNGGNDKIYQLTSKDHWITAEMEATTLIADRFSYPSTAARNNKDFWILNAKFNELVDSNNVPSKTFAIQQAIFKPIPGRLRK